MSLSPTHLLKPREVIENFNESNKLQQLSEDQIFGKVIGMPVQKRIFMNAIYSADPVHLIITGPPGNGKTLFLECVRDAFPYYSVWGDTVTSSGIGVIEDIILKANRARFLLLDEIEKFGKNDRHAFLGLLARGSINRKLRDRKYEIDGLKIWCFCTCNDYDWMVLKEKPFLDRCERIDIPALDYKTFLFIAGKRLLKETGVIDEDIGKYIAQRTYSEFHNEPNMRRAIRIARMANTHAIITRDNDLVTRDVVDEVIADIISLRLKI